MKIIMNKFSPLQNKNILFFSPYFFSYEKKIKTAFEKAGANVVLYDERSVSSPLSRALLKLAPCLFSNKTFRYYRRIVDDNKSSNFDYILIIRCDMVTKKIISLLKKTFPTAKLCLHLWDSTKNIKGIEKKLGLFDYVTSFDMDDCKKNPNMHFRPLFYTEEFVGTTLKKDYDLCFCGTIHSDRFFVMQKINEEIKKNNLSFFIFAYLPSKFIYFFYKIVAKGFKKARLSDFSFEKMEIKDVSNIEKRSKVVLDIQHPNQTGLTMRTIEMIGANQKFITTNKNIACYDFYNPNNIMIIDRNNPHFDYDFFDKEYEPIPEQVYSKYSLEQWILDVLGVQL